LGDLLLESELVTSSRLEEALLQQSASGKRLGELLVELGAIDDFDLARVLSGRLGVLLADLRRDAPEDDAIALIPESLARSHVAIPVSKTDTGLRVAMSDPQDDIATKELSDAAGMPVVRMIAPPSDIRRAIDKSYRALAGVGRHVDAFLAAEAITARVVDDTDAAADAPNGVAFPEKILDWRVIGVARVSAANGPGTLRVIVGNPTAVTAARSGDTNPWPDGSMISHYNWAASNNPETDAVLGAGVSVAPGAFNAFTLMQRSGAQYAADGNWAYGVWPTTDLTPPAAADPQFDRACVSCHTSSVPQRDMVFSHMAEFPPMMMPTALGAR